MTHHILAPFHLLGGGVWHAIDFARMLRRSGAEVNLWSARPSHPSLAPYAITTIAPYSGLCPEGGHLWVIGPDSEIGHWYSAGRFDEVTLAYNQHAPDLFYACMHRLSHAGLHAVSISYASTALAREIGLAGTVIPPAFDPDRFFGQIEHSRDTARRRFVVGRASRDVRYKHHVDDAALYADLLQAGCEVDLVGATSITDRLPDHPGLKISAEIPQGELPDLLSRLDCFIYRTSPRKPEGFGLCVMEAMAAGLPVVAARAGGYVDIIRSGENGFLFEDNEEALKQILLLKENPELRMQIGISAKTTIDTLFVR